jgi:hypothetical protein
MDAGVKRMLNTLTADSDFAAEEVRLTKQGGLSDADEAILGKLRDQDIAVSPAGLKEALKAGGIKKCSGVTKTKNLIHCVAEMLAQRSEAGLDDRAGGSSGGAGGGSSNRSTTVSQLQRRWSERE